ncbi:MAG: hypothetical protein PVJ92_02330, partial [Candidatus Dependentiae bacterium]
MLVVHFTIELAMYKKNFFLLIFGAISFLLPHVAEAAMTPDTLNITQATYRQFAADYVGTIPLPTDDDIIEPTNGELPELPASDRTKLALRAIYADNERLKKKRESDSELQAPIAVTHTTPLLWENLELFANPYRRPDKTIVGCLKRTNTIWGDLELTNMLTTLTHDTTVLRQRQGILRFFLKNRSLASDMRKELLRLNNHEDSLLSLLLASDALKSQATELFVKKNQGLGMFLPKKLRHHPSVMQFNSQLQSSDSTAKPSNYFYSYLTILGAIATASFWYKYLWKGKNVDDRPATPQAKLGVALAPFVAIALTYLLGRLEASVHRTTFTMHAYLRKRLKSVFYFRSMLQRLTSLVEGHTELAPLKAL